MTTLEEIQARARTATPGPWEWSVERDHWDDCGPNLETVKRGEVFFDGSQGAAELVIGSWGHDAWGLMVEPADAEFIANAREDVPKLAGVVGAVMKLHWRQFHTNQPSTCHEDGKAWPCPTQVAVEVLG